MTEKREETPIGPIYRESISILYPKVNPIMTPLLEIPADIQAIYKEAVEVFSASKRAAAALLRLALEKLCWKWGANPESKLFDQIGEIFKSLKDKKIPKAIDSIRVIANGDVHAGEIEESTDEETVYNLFFLINYIVFMKEGMSKKVDQTAGYGTGK